MWILIIISNWIGNLSRGVMFSARYAIVETWLKNMISYNPQLLHV